MLPERIATTRSNLDDAGVATLTLLHLLGNLGEQLVHDGLVADDTHHATTAVQITTLGERDQTLSQRTKALGLRQGGGDAATLEQLVAMFASIRRS